jgi:aspartyl-tRNA(Asn)/glutamyl-tRNA(Gln) amidotransferase subunit A
LGSETSGSILTPAAFCGVTGLRPTYGLVSRFGAMPLSWTLDKIGPMCRSAEDCGHVLQAISGKDSDDIASAGKSFYYAPQFARKFSDLKIGYAPVDFDEWAAENARPALKEALKVFQSFGAKIVETEIPDFPYGPVVSTIISAEGSAVFEDLIRSGKVDELADARQIAGLKSGLDIKASDYLKAMRIRTQIQKAFRRLFAGVDVILTPCRFGVAPKLSEPLDASRAGSTASGTSKSRGFRDLIPAGNLAGLPALSLPCGFADKLPVAVALVSRPFNENTLLAFGREFQNRTDWHKHRPPA